MSVPAPSAPRALVVGGGPAGLMAAEMLAAGGAAVTVAERMPSFGRRLLMAGRGGLNLTHGEPFETFVDRYGPAAGRLRPHLEAFPPEALRAWAERLGQPTFVGSSGRVFPRAMKASPLLRAWLGRLERQGVVLRPRLDWRGWDDAGAPRFAGPNGEQILPADVVVLALGGASWPRLGADGGWVGLLTARGAPVTPFRPSNAGFKAAWSEAFRQRFAGTPLKNIALAFGERRVRGEAMVAAYGLEGGAVYALSADLREALARNGTAVLTVDLRPGLTVEALAGRLARPRGRDSASNWLRKAAGLTPAQIGLLREIPGPLPTGPEKLAKRIKGVRVTLTAMRGLERAISSAGGVAWTGVDANLMLTALPGTFVAGEMLDWEAPTGGYLLQACFATGRAAGLGALARLGLAPPAALP